MALDVTSVKAELASLLEKKATLERKIHGLQSYLGIQKSSGKANGSSDVSARGGIDIRPTVRAFFDTRGNAPARLKDIIDAVAAEHPDTDRIIVEKKMVHVKRTILVQEGYGKYRLKNEPISVNASTDG